MLHVMQILNAKTGCQPLLIVSYSIIWWLHNLHFYW